MECGDLLKRIDENKTNTGRSSLKAEDIAEIVPFELENQTVPLFLVKQKVKSGEVKFNGSQNKTYRLIYDIIDEKGEVVAWIKAYTILSGTIEAEIEYAVVSRLRGKGIATAMLGEITNDVFKNRALDNLPVEVCEDKIIKKTKINKLFLSINEDNLGSKRVAEKNGYEYSKKSTQYELYSQKYLENSAPQPI